jgi:hypothetical protein
MKHLGSKQETMNADLSTVASSAGVLRGNLSPESSPGETRARADEDTTTGAVAPVAAPAAVTADRQGQRHQDRRRPLRRRQPGLSLKRLPLIVTVPEKSDSVGCRLAWVKRLKKLRGRAA